MELKINFTEVDIGLYIAEILEDHGKVSIPGVGIFYRKKIATYFDKKLQMFFPPDQKLRFEQTDDDDSGFSEYISKTENISADSADDIIKEFAAKFNDELKSSGTAEIPGVGILKKEGTQYTIEALSFYGLQPLPEMESVIPHITVLADPVHEDNTEVTNDYISQNTGETEQILENDDELPEDTEETEKTSGRKWFLVIVAVLILIGGPLYFFYPQINQFVQNRLAAYSHKEQKPVKGEALPQKPAESIADTTTKSGSVTTGSMSYEIIIASFSQRTEAETFIKQLTGKGVNVHLVEKPSGIYKYKVSAGSFKDRSSADDELPLAQKNLNKEAWIDSTKSKTN